MPVVADATLDWLLVEESGTVHVIPGDVAPAVLTAFFGLAEEAFIEAESLRSSRGGRIPTLILLGGRAEVRLLALAQLSRGGVA